MRVPHRGETPEEVYSVGERGYRASVASQRRREHGRVDEGGEHRRRRRRRGTACACFSADLGALVTGCEDGTIRIWEPSVSPDDANGCESGPGSEDGDEPEKESRLEDYLDGEETWLRRVMPGHQGRVAAVAELWDHALASAGADRTIRFWDLQTRREAHCIPDAHENAVHALERCALREDIATAAQGEDRVKIWRASGPYDPDEEEGREAGG